MVRWVMASKQVMINYRKRNGADGAGTLCDAIIAAMGSIYDGRPRDQLWRGRLDDTNVVRQQFVNRWRVNDDGAVRYAVGDLLMFEPNATLTFIREAESPSLDLETDLPEAGEHLVKGVGYWAAIGDHFLFIGDQSIRSADFENYFRWFISRVDPRFEEGFSLNAALAENLWERDPNGLTSFEAAISGRVVRDIDIAENVEVVRE
jgi:hypothetical protein